MIEDRTGIGGLIKEKIARFRRIFVHKLNAKEITVGTIKERVSGSGVTFDDTLNVDTIAESSSGAGVTMDGAQAKDGVIVVGDVAFDDGTSDPLVDGAAAADGTENSVARKDHVHPLHHAEAHNVASHSDTTATGAETETLTDGSDADALHAHTNHGVTHNDVHGISKHTGHAAWMALYTDASGDEQELALGADGEVLTSTGAAGVPAFEAAGGGGQDLATDTLWAAEGDLVKGTGDDAADILSIGAANTVLWSNGTVPSWSAAPRLANIADTAGTTRITTSAASPHVHIDETMRVDQALGIASNPDTTWAEVLTVSPTIPAGLTPPIVSVLKVNPTLQTTQAFGMYYALEGILNVVSQGSGQTIYEYGLSYVVVAVNRSVNVNTWAELMGLNMQLSMDAGASATLNVTLAASGKLTTPTFAGTAANINVATMHGLMVLNHGHARVANSYGIRIYDQTGSSVAAYGIYVEDADTYALWMDAGLSRFDGDGTHVFELPVNAVDPTGGGGAATGRIPCTIGGATRYLAYY